MHLTPCAVCRRHIRASEPRCPFCASSRRRPKAAFQPNLARAALIGGSVSLACVASTPGQPTTPGHTSEPTAPSGAPPASSQPAPQPPPEASSALPYQRPFVVPVYGGPMVVIVSRVHFEPSSTGLDAEARRTLQDVANLIESIPISQVITVEGHTDRSEKNPTLGQRRADAVHKALVDLGVNPDRMLTYSHGATQPLAPSDTPKNRAINRRVSFRIGSVP